jgi:hypothetical protein
MMTKRCRASRGCAGSPSHDVRILFRDADEQSSISIEIQIYPNIYPYMYFIIFIPDSSKFSDSQEHHNSLQHTGTWKFERWSLEDNFLPWTWQGVYGFHFLGVETPGIPGGFSIFSHSRCYV